MTQFGDDPVWWWPSSLTHICITSHKIICITSHKSHDRPLCKYLTRYDTHIQSHPSSWPNGYIYQKNWNPMKRLWVIIRKLTVDGRTDRRTNRRTGWIQHTPTQLCCRRYKKNTPLVIYFLWWWHTTENWIDGNLVSQNELSVHAVRASVGGCHSGCNGAMNAELIQAGGWKNSIKIQSCAAIKRSNIVRYHINNCRNSGRISIRCWIHKRHPATPPNGRAVGCLLRIFLRKLTTL